LEQVSDIGPRVAASIREFFSHQEQKKIIAELWQNGVDIIKEDTFKKTNQIFSGKSFVFTGGMSEFTRDGAKDMVRERGGEVSESVSKKTNYVVAGTDPGSKYEKAVKLGVTILTENQFKKML
jgi:DNA ligase (NAD+)